jgi:hypothetical protein
MSTRGGFYVTVNNKSKNDPIKFKDGIWCYWCFGSAGVPSLNLIGSFLDLLLPVT